jgi:hypothetical protein
VRVDRLFDLLELLAARVVAPLALGRTGRDPRQLADRSVRQLARGERFEHLGQVTERERDADSLPGLSWRVTQYLF